MHTVDYYGHLPAVASLEIVERLMLLRPEELEQIKQRNNLSIWITEKDVLPPHELRFSSCRVGDVQRLLNEIALLRCALKSALLALDAIKPVTELKEKIDSVLGTKEF